MYGDFLKLFDLLNFNHFKEVFSMCKTLSNLRVSYVRHHVFVWMALAILSCFCAPAVSGAQQATAAEAAPETVGPGELLWKFETETRLRSFTHSLVGPTSAAIADGMIYFGGFDGNLYAVDRQTGQERWRFETGDSVFAFPPTIADGVIYFGSFDYNLYAVDIETGQEKWRFETRGKVDSSPAIVDGVAYFGSWDNNFYAVDIETGQEKWRFETGGRVETSPSVVDGAVYFGSWDDHFYAVDIETGQEKWKFKTGFHSMGNSSSPAIVDGVVYIGSDDKHLYALDLETGQEIWRFNTKGDTPSSPTIVDGVVYIGSQDAHLYAVNSQTGQEKWKFRTNGFVFSSPTVADGVVYVGSRDYNLYAVDSQTGQELWRFETEGAVIGSPVFADGVVYFLSGDGTFYAVRAAAATVSEVIASKVEDLVGIWETRFMGAVAYMQFEADGTVKLAYTIKDMKRTQIMSGKVWFEGTVFHMDDNIDSGEGTYEVRVQKEGDRPVHLSFIAIDDAHNPNRLRDLTKGMTRVEP